jgi:purine nucleoside permease
VVSFTSKTDLHDINEILLKVALNTIKQTTNKCFIDHRNKAYLRFVQVRDSASGVPFVDILDQIY